MQVTVTWLKVQQHGTIHGKETEMGITFVQYFFSRWLKIEILNQLN